jgi:hypothetical protein
VLNLERSNRGIAQQKSLIAVLTKVDGRLRFIAFARKRNDGAKAECVM